MNYYDSIDLYTVVNYFSRILGRENRVSRHKNDERSIKDLLI